MKNSAKKVLVVDDQVQIRNLIGKALKASSHKVETCSNAHEAVAQIQHKKYDLILTDMKMPKGDGSILLNYLKDSNHKEKVIVMSAAGDLSYSESVNFHEVCEAVLLKPFGIDQLLNGIKSCLR